MTDAFSEAQGDVHIKQIRRKDLVMNPKPGARDTAEDAREVFPTLTEFIV